MVCTSHEHPDPRARPCAHHVCLAGVELVLYGMTMNALVNHRKQWTRTDKFYMAFSTALLVLITIYMSTEAVFGQEMWIVHADSPGGSLEFLIENADIWYQTMGTTASVILNLFSDALLVSFFLRSQWHPAPFPLSRGAEWESLPGRSTGCTSSGRAIA